MGYLQSTGEVFIDGMPLKNVKQLKLNATIETKPNASVRFSIHKNAFLLKESTRVRFSHKKNGVLEGIEVLNGALLGVFDKGKKTIKTPTVTAGLRGTGVFVRARKNYTYFCDCYGKVDIVGTKHKHLYKELNTKNHGAFEFFNIGEKHLLVTPQKALEHTNEQLRFLESLVGRVPDFDKSAKSQSK